MSTTLEQELLEAADSADGEADILDAEDPQGPTMAPVCRAFAARLRQRVVWVRELEAKWAPSPALANMLSGFEDTFRYRLWTRCRAELLASLTGPIPSETAPAEGTGRP